MPDSEAENMCISRCKMCYRADKGLLGKDVTEDDLNGIRSSLRYVIADILINGESSTEAAYLCQDCKYEEPWIADYLEKRRHAPAKAEAAEAAPE